MTPPLDLKAIKAEVEANEPGTTQYHPVQSTEDENTFYVWEEVRGQPFELST